MVITLTPRQATLIHGWWNPSPSLTWNDVKQKRLTLDYLLQIGLRPSELVLIQSDPKEWAQHAGASIKHARQMMVWPANPFTHLGADLADVLSMKLSVEEMILMDITHAQLHTHGMTAQTKHMFRFDEDEWRMIPSK